MSAIGSILTEDDIGLSLPSLLKKKQPNDGVSTRSSAVAAESIIYDNVAVNVVGLITK
jgi:hypothetical protein